MKEEPGGENSYRQKGDGGPSLNGLSASSLVRSR
jgi:hypothetical protein